MRRSLSVGADTTYPPATDLPAQPSKAHTAGGHGARENAPPPELPPRRPPLKPTSSLHNATSYVDFGDSDDEAHASDASDGGSAGCHDDAPGTRPRLRRKTTSQVHLLGLATARSRDAPAATASEAPSTSIATEKAAATLKIDLDALKFRPAIDRDEQAKEQQLLLQQEYIDWAAPLRETRERHLRNPLDARFDDSYQSWGTTLKAGFSNARAAFWGGATRPPTRNMVTTALAPRSGSNGELDNRADTLSVSGTAASLPSFVHEHVTKPVLDDAAKRLNVPRLKPVPVDDLHPMPGPVFLYVSDDRRFKQFYRPKERGQAARHVDGLPTMPTRPKAEDRVRRKRDEHRKIQAALEQRHVASTSRAFMTALSNVARRAALSATDLQSPWIVGLASMLSSGGAAFANDMTLAAAKAAARVSVDDLAGGASKRSMPLFTFDYPRTDAGPPSWRQLLLSAPADELRHLPQRAAELLDAIRHEPFAAGTDWFVRHALANIGSALFGLGYAAVVASIFSDGRLDGNPGEGPHSSHDMALQFFNSLAGSWTWDATRRMVEELKFDVGAAVRARREIAAVAAQEDTGASA